MYGSVSRANLEPLATDREQVLSMSAKEKAALGLLPARLFSC